VRGMRNLHALMTVPMEAIMTSHDLIVGMESATMAKRFLALMIAVYSPQPLNVEMAGAIVVRNPPAQMIAHLNAPQDKSQMVMVDASMIVLVYAALHGTILNNDVCAPPNTWTMETAIVFIIMFIMVVVAQWVLYYRELVVYALKDSGITWATVH
jgi:hypothetical protein